MSEAPELCYLLRAEGRIHTADVRHVSSSSGLLLTSSRDQTTFVIDAPGTTPWSSGDDFPTGLTLTGHTAFVNFAIMHSGIPLLGGEPCVITGGNDKHVALWNPQTAALEAVLDSHSHGVCCGLVVTSTVAEGAGHDGSVGDIVTGDWGGMCLVFDATTGDVKQCYRGHSTAVRGITQLPRTSSIVSASGDKTLHQWNVATGEEIAVYTGHTDVVQCVCAISSTRFASGSNDATIIIWDTTVGTHPLRSLLVHHSLVYSLCFCNDRQLLFSASEDCTVKVISGASTVSAPTVGSSVDVGDVAVVQSINHPCVVWSVCTTEIGDIVTGAADGAVRVWTLNDELMASVGKLEALAEAVATQKLDIKITSIAGTNIADLPPVEQLHQKKGVQEGERCFVRTKGETVEVYAWDQGRWEKIGIVTEGTQGQPYTGVQSGSAAQKPKVYFNGVPYDYVFDVDVNGTMLKLPYNRGQNIFDAAQDFINKNSAVVSQTHKEEIQNFILNNIDPQDALLLTGSQQGLSVAGGGAVSGGGNHEPVFSQFAREAMEMRQAGASHVPSWGEALRNMENAGVTANDVAFSGYAREEIELQRQQEKQLPQAPTAGGSDVVAWSSHRYFTSINLEGVQKKINELTGGTEFGELVKRVEAGARAAPSVGLLLNIMELHKRLPEASRFPALDLLSRLLAVGRHPYRWLLLLLGDSPGEWYCSPLKFMEECVLGVDRASDAECLVTVRLFLHAAAALDALPASTSITPEQAAVLLQAFTQAPRSFIKKNMNNNMKKSVSALLQNVSLLLAHGAPMFGDEGRLNCTQECVRMASHMLLLEPMSSPVIAEVVATVLTLLQAESTANAAAAVGRGTLLHTMRLLKSGSEQRCRRAADIILRVLEADGS
ncbi:hypothetical protein, conserved [Trypanosoma brucei gambiense DAL972]|uniref:Guanine nucleotide-binding protein subunit beta-like protein n=1 Tax=Trypanosoma brucei gambiense (strain MHOM/CI/86/DAL972) TaxID=679716 RepID=C9ZWB2_TRYB9|nr:hypothetical protein, conserved [Trypanosoma brucei gambiense DAL972]CBH13701.1 hypothetical protein, conserved [Trypanosoma brucei gambiense DAL972]|eukprot:XP_011775977.1 hypothetical protein, conserved [Trypanosoma brucei gambiense DAL972]